MSPALRLYPRDVLTLRTFSRWSLRVYSVSPCREIISVTTRSHAAVIWSKVFEHRS